MLCPDTARFSWWFLLLHVSIWAIFCLNPAFRKLGVIMNNENSANHREKSPEKTHIFDNPENVKKLLRFFFSSVVALLVIDIVYMVLSEQHIIHRHVEYEWEKYWSFYSIYGFVACVLLVLVSKYILRPLMKRKENYYDN